MPIITVVTFNIRHGLGMDGNVDLQKTAQALSECQADLICLQEVDRGRGRSGYMDQAAWLADRLKLAYVFGAVPHDRNRSYGNAILFKHEVIAQTNHTLPAVRPDRSMLELDLNIEGEKLRIFNTHMGLNRDLRRKQIQNFMIPLFNASSIPVILSGDFNENPDDEGVRSLLNTLQDSIAANRGTMVHGFPADNPRERMDYIFVNQFCTVLDFRIMKSLASDHLPVLARVAF